MPQVQIYDTDIARGEGFDDTMLVGMFITKGMNGGRINLPEIADPEKADLNKFVQVKSGRAANAVQITFLAPLADANRVLSEIIYNAPENPATIKDEIRVVVNDLGNFGAVANPLQFERLLSILVNCFFASPPLIFDAKFDNSAARILITFDRDTDKTMSPFNPIETQLRGRDTCSKILFEGTRLAENVTTASWLGQDSICYWATPSILAAQCGPGASTLPWDHVEIIPGRIRACENAVDSTTGSIVVKPPDQPPQPGVSLIGVTQLGVCEHAVLDGSLTTGGGGRPLKYRWRLLNTIEGNVKELIEQGKPSPYVSLNAENSTSLQAQFSVSEHLDVISIDGTLGQSPLPAGYTYVFQVRHPL